jgi:hypothetical protein
VARAWGGLCATPLPPLPVAAHAGDRQGWVDALHVALAGQRCHVRRGGAHDRHDLRATAGPLLACRLTTGLRWGSTPVLTLRTRPRAGACVALAALLAVSVSGAVVLPVLSMAVLAGGLLVERAVLRRRLARAVALTQPGGAA